MNQDPSDENRRSDSSRHQDPTPRPESASERRAHVIESVLPVWKDRLRTEGERSVICNLKTMRDVMQLCDRCNQEAKDEMDLMVREVAGRLGLMVPGL